MIVGALRQFQAIWHQRQRAQPISGGVKDGIRNCWRQTDHRALSRSSRGKVLAVEQNGFDDGKIAEAWNAILRHPAIEDSAVLKLDGFEESPTHPLNVRSFDLIAEVSGVHDGAALESGNDPYNFHRFGLAIHIDLREGRNISQLFVAAAHSKSPTRLSFLFSPAELVRRSLENCAQSFVSQVLHAELKRIHLQSTRQFVHVRLARKMVCRGGERAI